MISFHQIQLTLKNANSLTNVPTNEQKDRALVVLLLSNNFCPAGMCGPYLEASGMHMILKKIHLSYFSLSL